MSKRDWFAAGEVVYLPKKHQTLGGWYGKGAVMQDAHKSGALVLCPLFADANDRWRNWKLVCADQVRRVRQKCSA